MTKIAVRKLYKQLPSTTPWSLKSFLPRSKWLFPTVGKYGWVQREFQPMVLALEQLSSNENVSTLQNFRLALKTQKYDEAKELWNKIKTSKASISPKRPSTWKELSTLPYYGPSVLTNALNDICRHVRGDPQLVNSFFEPYEQQVLQSEELPSESSSHSTTPSQDPPLMPYLLGYLLKRRGADNFDFCLRILSRGWSANTRILAATALLESVQMDPTKVKQVLEASNLPESYRLPPSLVAQLSQHYQNPHLVDIYDSIVPFLNPRFPVVDQLIRRVFFHSDAGSQKVIDNSTSRSYPFSIYPLLVRTLCSQYSVGDEDALQKLDAIFDTVLVNLAATKPSMVLGILVQRIIATEGIQATGPVLSRWTESDPSGVSESAWLLLFQSFRRMGRPDKCVEVLERAMKTYPKISLPFLGEYLSFVARFYNCQFYLNALSRVLPEMIPVLDQLKLIDYVENKLPVTPAEAPLVELPLLSPENRNFTVGDSVIHESWLVITYQALLSTVEDTETALELYHHYINFVEQSDSSASMRVVDQFVQLVASKQLSHPVHHGPTTTNKIDTAEYILRNAYERIGGLNSSAVTSGNTKSLELVCHQLAISGQVQRALRLLLDAAETYNVTVKGSIVNPWLKTLPVDIRENLTEWLQDKNAFLKVTE